MCHTSKFGCHCFHVYSRSWDWLHFCFHHSGLQSVPNWIIEDHRGAQGHLCPLLSPTECHLNQLRPCLPGHSSTQCPRTPLALPTRVLPLFGCCGGEVDGDPPPVKMHPGPPPQHPLLFAALLTTVTEALIMPLRSGRVAAACHRPPRGRWVITSIHPGCPNGGCSVSLSPWR